MGITIFPPFFSFNLAIVQAGAEKTSVLINKVHVFPFLQKRMPSEVIVNLDMAISCPANCRLKFGAEWALVQNYEELRLSFFAVFFSPKRSL